jgi:hypothetical protein
MKKYNPKFVKTEINSTDKIFEIFDLLHDATISEEKILYDTKRKTLDIWAEREFFEDESLMQRTRFLLIFTKSVYPIVLCHIHFNMVEKFKLISKDKSLKVHSFNEVEFDGVIYTLRFSDVLEIEFVFGSELPKGYFEDMEITGEKERFGIIPI